MTEDRITGTGTVAAVRSLAGAAFSLLLAAAPAFMGAASASEFRMTIFGHEVTIDSNDDGETLKVDGAVLHSNIYVSVTQVALVAGMPVVIGDSSAGGNACAGSPFVLRLPKDGLPSLDAPLDTCMPVTATEGEGRLVFAIQPLPGRDGERWSWDPAAGFKTLDAVAFVPDAAKGWRELAATAPGHPGDLFGYAEIAAQMEGLLGKDAEDYKQIITGVGSGEMKNGFYIGTACKPHNCGGVEALVAADPGTKQVYLAWKPQDEKIIVRPEVKEWPAIAKAVLRDWAATWK
ncbi:hypothetical protein J5N58_12600 [Rhizobium cremeum]|uniref:hypothetical protein n=1 Tax=Rhizobium cremeum TaxID=2813827 RepID=UPI000DDD67C3|nr:hypothetical protein [Rhizobium cremeum]MCJ7995172.1 hypothetical protein [Rhizobium cremeum]MCJ8000516.1 hypothetical protein [Rhizobium cremeum]